MVPKPSLHRPTSNRVSGDPLWFVILLLSFVFALSGAAIPAAGALLTGPTLAVTPPMSWSAWAHYQCGYTAQTILNNARELIKTGLAARGYNTVRITECWMEKERDASGNLVADPQRFPHGIEAVIQTIHGLGLKVGIYGDAGYATCAGYAGSGTPKDGGKAHFLQDARLFASWGVDFLKLDGCNVYVPPGSSKEAAYRKAYAAEAAALKAAGRPVVFLESAPAYFQGTPEWYDVLTWVRRYGQLWREGSDMANFSANHPNRPRFNSVLWNYAYNLQLGRFQTPGHWNDADYIIAGDRGMSLAESRSQMALWSMMSVPLTLSLDIQKLSPESLAIVGNKEIIAVDQDPLGRMATLVRRTPVIDVLFKLLANGDDAVAVLNRGEAPVKVNLHPAEFGFAPSSRCTLDARDLWNDKEQASVASLQAEVTSHDTMIWRVHPSAQCGKPSRTGTITLTANVRAGRHSIDGYTRCLASPGSVGSCVGIAVEKWTVTSGGALRSSGDECLALAKAKPVLEACHPAQSQKWRYTITGNLINATRHDCLSAAGTEAGPQKLVMRPCGHNLPNQIWSLPN